MRLALDPRARRLLRRLPRTTVYSVLELILLFLIATQCARLAWTLVTPLGPVGDWKTAASLRPVQPAPSALGDFDPFFRAAVAGAGPVVVTALNLQLFGVREDRASGRSSAIIGIGGGQQRSFVVGEEIMPGVTLTAVNFDSVTVSRGGVPEQLFLDQSPSAPGAGPPPPVPAPSVAPTPPPLPVVVAPPPAPQGGAGNFSVVPSPQATPEDVRAMNDLAARLRAGQAAPQRPGNSQ